MPPLSHVAHSESGDTYADGCDTTGGSYRDPAIGGVGYVKPGRTAREAW